MKWMAVPVVLAGALLIAACQPPAILDPLGANNAGEEESQTPAARASEPVTRTVTSTSSAAPSLRENVVQNKQPRQQTSEPVEAACSKMSGEQAVRSNIDQLPDSGWEWDAEYADASGYDPCASLSWAIVPIEHGTSSSPYHIMLFHNGEYLGTATLEAYGFFPTVTRADNSTIDVIYHYPNPGDSNAETTGETYASFRWDDDLQRVVMTGDTPPRNR